MKLERAWLFGDAPSTPVVTTRQVTERQLPILYVSHEQDEDGLPTWHFLCLTVPFAMEDAQLVRLDTIVELDPSITTLAELPLGYCALRTAPGAEWRWEQEGQ